jgi:hypothetical protein
VRIQIQDLGTIIQGGRSGAIAINNRGHVVGFASIDPLDLSREGPFLWSPQGGMQSILDSFDGVAWDLNDRDDVVGTFYTVGWDAFHGFLWSRQKVASISEPSSFPRRSTIAARSLEYVWHPSSVTRNSLEPSPAFGMTGC